MPAGKNGDAWSECRPDGCGQTHSGNTIRLLVRLMVEQEVSNGDVENVLRYLQTIGVGRVRMGRFRLDADALASFS